MAPAWEHEQAEFVGPKVCFVLVRVSRTATTGRPEALQSGLHGQSKPCMGAQPRLVSVPGSSLGYAKANAELTAMSKRGLGK